MDPNHPCDQCDPPPDPLIERATTWWGASILTVLTAGLFALALYRDPWAAWLPGFLLSASFCQMVRLAHRGQPNIPFGSTR